MKIHQLTVEEALASLRTQPAGLTGAEAQRRLGEFGPNRVERVRGEALLTRFLRGFTHFFALILWIAAALAFLAEQQAPGQGMATLGAAIIGVILINGAFSFWQEFRAERMLEALTRLLPHEVKVMREGAVAVLPAAVLVPGDLVLLEAGDNIPADCRVIEAFGARVNNATVTGESVPLPRDAAPVTGNELLRARNILLAGTSLVSGEVQATVFATGMHTEFGKIAHLTQLTETGPSPLQREIVRVSRVIAALSLALGIVFFFIGNSLGLSFWTSLLFAIGIIVANVPEGLLPTVTLALAMSSQRMARRHMLIRHLPSVESLGCATVICTDKTGTLTENRMEVRRLFVGGAFFEPDGLPAATDHRRFFEAALHCHDLKPTGPPGARTWLGDPMEVALVGLAQRALPGTPMHPRLDEIPFDSERRRQSTLHQADSGRVLYTKGALESVLPLCAQVQQGPRPEPLTAALAQRLRAAEETMAAQGLRVLALAYRPVSARVTHAHLEEKLILTGLVGFRDPPRAEVSQAVRKCHEAGIKVIMVTGDHPHTANAIARETGLVHSDQAVVISGERLRKLSNAELQLALDAREILFARVNADQKLRIVDALKRKGEIVATTGDGVNDAPALRRADIGIAMGVSGTDVARESAHMVLLDDNFASIVAAVEEGRAVYDNIRKFLSYVLTSNVPELVPYLAFVLFRIPLPLTIIQILVVDLGTDMVPALGLGAEPPEPGVMKRPPRPPHERLLSRPLLIRAYAWLGILESVAAMAAFFFVLKGGGWRYGEALAAGDPLYRQATTACLSAIIVMQVVNVFLCRSAHESVRARGLLGNRLILLGLLVEIALILLIDYSAVGNRLFGTAPITLDVWLFVVPFAAAMLLLEEARKHLVRRLSSR
jgi:calcium-translocating P-type ATPase